jgi:ATP-dependent helicase/nuclease subunit A
MSTAPQRKLQVTPAPEGLDPHISVWVSASAGSGKTTLLVKRVLRLLLEGGGKSRRSVPRILCLTYTRAAAAEMQNRIQKVLAEWAVDSDEKLRESLLKDFNLTADKDLLKHARRLFGQVLEHPERVRVATLHAFCQMVLNRFPLEAGVPPHFTLLEGNREDAFQDRILQSFFEDFSQDTVLKNAFEYLADTNGPDHLKKQFKEIFEKPQRWEALFTRFRTSEMFEYHMRHRLGLGDIVDEKILTASLIKTDAEKLKWVASILSGGGKNDSECASDISDWLDAGSSDFDSYAATFLTKELEKRKKFPTQAIIKANPDLVAWLNEEIERIYQGVQQLRTLRFYHRQSTWYALFSSLWQRLQAAKVNDTALTYDDLILRTRALLENRSVCAWVLYKLDGGIDHLLLDEAQDTSPAQWDILFALLDEFLSGQGSRDDVERTIFVVGDEKQSIYSFQGANRAYYLSAREKLFKKLDAAQRPWREVPLTRSRRTPKAILDYVDAVFKQAIARAGVAEAMAHESARLGEPAYVELWPPVMVQKLEKPAPWAPPLQREEGKPAPVELAENIAAKIRVWLDEKWHLSGEKRAVQPGDILILLQRRSQLLLPIVRALKDKHIPVAGVDRMVLAEAAAVQDVLSLCKFLLLPEDDLTCAEVLRGPFIRLSDEQLFTLAHNRGGLTLWQRVQENPAYEKETAYIKELLRHTDYISAFALLNEILFKPCPADDVSGQHALVRRLGLDAVDPLEELLGAALMLEAREAPSLQLFVQAIMRSQKESKRELTKAGGEVRILTVHSAKGLEAPIVIIPDLARNPTKQGHAPVLLWNEEGLPLSMGGGAEAAMIEDAKENSKLAQEEENRRLLYVALTRAREVLVLCGLAKPDAKEEPPWHAFCRAGMDELKAETLEGGTRRYGDASAFAPPLKAGTQAVLARAPLPVWVRKVPENTGAKPRIINPSQVAATNEKVLPPADRLKEQNAYRRGQLLHRLLQMLPLATADARENLATEFLKHHQPEKSGAERTREVKEVMAVLNDKKFSAVFAAGSRAEVPVIGYVEGKRISGQIDRLAVTEKEVLIIDFKTNRPPPENVEDIPETYLAQMAAYRALMEKIYSGRTVRCALVWTFNLSLMELPEALYERGRTILKGA